MPPTNSKAVCAFTLIMVALFGPPSLAGTMVYAQAGCSTPSFVSTTNFPVGNSPQAMDTGDFNGDGNVDIVTANLNSNNVSILLGNGAGGFTGPVNFAAGLGVNSVNIADFNGDGKADLAVANQNPSPAAPAHSVSILTGNGDGTFSAPVDFTAGSFPRSLVVSDFNGDGKADVAVANAESKEIRVLPGTGTGNFGAAVVTPSGMTGFSGVFKLAVGDFNGDGKSDLVGLREKSPQPPFGPGNLTIFLGTGTGGFTTGETRTLGINPGFIAVGNLNADAFSDLAVTNRASDSVSVLLGTGSGTFSAPQSFSTGAIPESVAISDLNLDGKNDLAVPNQSTGDNVSIYLGDGAGNFTASGNFAIGSVPFDVVVADFNEDGKNDLATANFSSNNVSVLLNSCAAAAQTVIQIQNPTYVVVEDQLSVMVGVSRTGLVNNAVTVDYTTVDGTASERSDYSTAVGTLRFDAGQTTSGFIVLINEDSLVEGPEAFSIALSNPTGGATLGSQSTAAVQITDDTSEPSSNAIDDAYLFVGQHYHDFLNRQADNDGLFFWKSEISNCGGDAGCIDFKRASVSQAFFLSIEFQRTGYQVFRVYKASFTDSQQRPKGLPRFREFLKNTQELQRNVVVGQGDWEQQLNANLQEFITGWVQGSEFLIEFPLTLTAQQFVDKLFSNSEVIPTQSERDAAIAAFGAGQTSGRANALLSVTNSGSVYNRQFNPAFVLMQYFGYLRRNPNDAPEAGLNYDGYEYWLNKLNQFSLPGEDVRDEVVARQRALRAEMVRSFLIAVEYRQRFGA